MGWNFVGLARDQSIGGKLRRNLWQSAKQASPHNVAAQPQEYLEQPGKA